MIIAISILLVLFTGVAFYLLWKANRKNQADTGKETAPAANIDPSCCGAHEICDFDATKADPAIIEYFDDEELDQLKAINPKNFSAEQIDMLRDVLYTLQKHEIRKWLLSLERRYIHLPDILLQEARDLQM